MTSMAWSLQSSASTRRGSLRAHVKRLCVVIGEPLGSNCRIGGQAGFPIGFPALRGQETACRCDASRSGSATLSRGDMTASQQSLKVEAAPAVRTTARRLRDVRL